MQSTSISLLARDGGLRVTFAPALTPEQYAQLAEHIERDGDTRESMTVLLRGLGQSWGRSVLIDPC